MKENILAYLMAAYARLSYTCSYVFGYAVKGIVYAARVENADPILPLIASPDRASSKNGGTYSAKYKPNAKKWAIITAAAVEVKPICTVEYMEYLFKTTKMNRGDIFEMLAAQAFNMVQVDKKNAKFNLSGDMVDANGRHYQAKYNKATFTDERTIHNMMGE